MSKLEVFILKRCPYCKSAMKHVIELMDDYPEFASLDIEWIDERKEKERANALDYYLVPTFYLNGEKLHEGGIGKDKIYEILRKTVELNESASK